MGPCLGPAGSTFRRRNPYLLAIFAMELASGHFRVEDVGFAVQEGSVDVAGLVQEIVLQAANRRIYFADAQVHRPGIEREVRWRSGIPRAGRNRDNPR